MKIIEPIVYSSLEELEKDLDKIKNLFFEQSIVLIRGLKLSDIEHLELTKKLGDVIGWSPNSLDSFIHDYTENHSQNYISDSPRDIFLDWHLEHIDYDKYVPLVAGVWNMKKFTCSSESGMTYFMDSRKVYNQIFSDSEREFLKACTASWSEEYRQFDISVDNDAKVVSPHWITGEDQIRVEMIFRPPRVSLLNFDGNNPTPAQSKLFEDLVNRFIEEHYKNEELRMVQKWQEGDILIPDLHCLAHAVTGGFSPDEREFTGLWCYLDDPYSKNAKQHPAFN